VCRLWHQLTQKVDEFFDYPLAKPYRVDVFTRFVRDFEERLNPLRLAEMGIKISQDIDSMPNSPLSVLVLIDRSQTLHSTLNS
jgi:26S proteasome regulatory subunit N9